MTSKKLKSKSKSLHSPTLKTVQMIEGTLKKMDESMITVAQLKRKLPRMVNHNTLMVILEYLEASKKIDVNLRGIVWVENKSPKLQKAVREGFEM